MAEEGKFEINDQFVGRWLLADDGQFDIYVVPRDPKRNVFHGVIYANDEGGYTKYDQASEKAKETVQVLVDEAILDRKYIEDVVIEKEAKEIAWKEQRIIELKAELASLEKTSEEVIDLKG